MERATSRGEAGVMAVRMGHSGQTSNPAWRGGKEGSREGMAHVPRAKA